MIRRRTCPCCGHRAWVLDPERVWGCLFWLLLVACVALAFWAAAMGG